MSPAQPLAHQLAEQVFGLDDGLTLDQWLLRQRNRGESWRLITNHLRGRGIKVGQTTVREWWARADRIAFSQSDDSHEVA
jgi:hypothetical protein